jgi:hypothetical protein
MRLPSHSLFAALLFTVACQEPAQEPSEPAADLVAAPDGGATPDGAVTPADLRGPAHPQPHSVLTGLFPASSEHYVTWIDADLDLDGREDVVATYYDGQIVILLQRPGGSFQSKVLMQGVTPYSVAVGDLDRDGRPDLVVVTSSLGRVVVWKGDGHGDFSSLGETLLPGAPGYAVALADFDRDGRLDVFVGGAGSSPNALLTGNGVGGFSRVDRLLDVPLAAFAVAADMNGDGNPDLVTGAEIGYVHVSLGNGRGGFGIPSDLIADPDIRFGEGGSIRGLAVADLNSDGKPDVAASFSRGMQVALGDGRGGRTTVLSPAGTAKAVQITVHDVDEDGAPDLIFGDALRAAGVLFGDGHGGFAPVRGFPILPTSTTSPLLAGEFDGLPGTDLLSSTYDAHEMRVVLELIHGDGRGWF